MVVALCYGHKICKFESCTRIIFNVIYTYKNNYLKLKKKKINKTN